MTALAALLGSKVSAPPRFLPTSISGNVFWVAADLGISTPGGVLNWADQSGTGDANKNCASPSAGASPIVTVSNALFNNRASIDWHSQSLYLKSGTWTTPLPQPFTEILVCSSISQSGGNPYATDGLTAQASIYGAAGGASLPNRVQGYNGDYLSSIPGGDMRSPSVVCVVMNGASSKIYWNSATPLTGTTGTGATGRTGITIGTYGPSLIPTTTWGAATAPGNGDGSICSIADWNRALSPSEVATAMNGFGAYYGITIS